MANIKPAEISAIIRNQLTGSKVGPSLDEVGTVLQVGDGIARVYGLSNVQYGELVEFDNGMEGMPIRRTGRNKTRLCLQRRVLCRREN